MDQLQQFLVPIIVLLLNLLGKVLKEWNVFPTEYIPHVLGALGGIVGILLFKDANAVLVGVGAVGLHQIYKQSTNKENNNNDRNL
uniref:Holin n=1 Tax=Siphoviridae sp. ct8eQ1 TaxID=2826171 RepID=A0A8S5MZV5_9CAUD|nr:MAG TPA: holin [Siphoviridae sp. ct8eQ1]